MPLLSSHELKSCNVTLLMRHGSNVAVKLCYPSSTYACLVEFVCRKWNFMEGRKMVFTYEVQDIGECYLTEADDITAMFALIRRYALEELNVRIDLQDGNGFGFEGADSVSSTEEALADHPNHMPTVGSDQSLMSVGWAKSIDHEGQCYPGGAPDFRKELIKYSVELGFDFKYVKNEPDRITAECMSKRFANCPWRVHACAPNFGAASKKKFNSKVIVDLIADDICNMPGISPRDVQKQVKAKFGVDITYYVAWKSTVGGRARVFGDHSQSYSTLAVYLLKLERTNPGSAVDLDIDPIKGNFMRCFFSFGACINGFK